MQKLIFSLLVAGVTSIGSAHAQSCSTVTECAQEAASAAQQARDIMQTLVPSGAVIAFNLTECPSGWEPYIAAQGRFIRGFDPTGGIDPGRTIGSTQEDAFQGHYHVMDKGGAPGLWDSTQGKGPTGRAAKTDYKNGETFRVLGPTTGAHGATRIANETRPKNVSLLFCERL